MSNPVCIYLWDDYAVSPDLFAPHANKHVINIQYNISLQELETQDFSRLQVFAESLFAIGRPARQSLLFCFEEADNILVMAENHMDVAYIEHVFELYPHIPYFIADFYTSIYFKRLSQLDSNEVWKRLRAMRDAVAQYGKSIGDELTARDIVRCWRIELDKFGVL